MISVADWWWPEEKPVNLEKSIEIKQSEEQRKNKIRKNEQSSRDLWENVFLINNMCVIGVPEGEEKQAGKKIFNKYLA